MNSGRTCPQRCFSVISGNDREISLNIMRRIQRWIRDMASLFAVHRKSLPDSIKPEIVKRIPA
jgi:hypothetical protein